jgi:prepilin-type N-terminal cleavage/methylation domain-containing protein
MSGENKVLRIMIHQSKNKRRGFTLIELLVVIAIIAVIAAMIFPMASTMRERGNQTACLSNLQNIGQALKLYRLDERSYPPALYGYVENTPDPIAETATTDRTFLYPHYLRTRRDFKCPNNLNRFDETKTAGPFQGKTDIQSAVPLHVVKDANGNVTVEPITDNAIAYYLFDSYDGAVLPPTYRYTGTAMFPVYQGDGLTAVVPANAGYRLHYRPDWVSILNKAWDPNGKDAGRELLNRNPEDKTFVTACTYHRTYSGAGDLAPGANSLDMILFLDGHTETRPSDQMSPSMLPKGS